MTDRVKYTGFNFDEVKAFCGDKILAPYFCMGFSMLSLYTDDGFITVNEGDIIVKDNKGTFYIEK